MTTNSSLPLAGVRVLDLSRVLAGPWCAMVLGDLGAEVIKVEPPTGDDYRHIGPMREGMSSRFMALNRNKKELMCNAYGNAGGRWLVNPMFIEPRPQQAQAYACASSACKSADGNSVACLDEEGKAIPDQADTVFSP